MEKKGNDGKGNNLSRDDWETPNKIINMLKKQYDFTFDCCALEENKKFNNFSSNFETIKKVEGIAWMNPPFSIAFKMFEHFFKVVNKGVSIYRCDNMETKIWQELILQKADWVLIPKGRVAYDYNPELRDGKGCRFPSALIGIGVEPPVFYEGKILFTNN